MGFLVISALYPPVLHNGVHAAYSAAPVNIQVDLVIKTNSLLDVPTHTFHDKIPYRDNYPSRKYKLNYFLSAC